MEEFVATDLVREATPTLRGLEEFYEHSVAKVGKKTWNREDIHARKVFLDTGMCVIIT